MKNDHQKITFEDSINESVDFRSQSQTICLESRWKIAFLQCQDFSSMTLFIYYLYFILYLFSHVHDFIKVPNFFWLRLNKKYFWLGPWLLVLLCSVTLSERRRSNRHSLLVSYYTISFWVKKNTTFVIRNHLTINCIVVEDLKVLIDANN